MKNLRNELAESWFHFLGEEPICTGAGEAPWAYCRKCRGLSAPGPGSAGTCSWCGMPTVPLDFAYWKKISRMIQRAVKRDPNLVARVKAKLPWVRPEVSFRGPLEWLQDLWRRASKPRGRPPIDERRTYWIDAEMRILTRTIYEGPGEPGEPVLDNGQVRPAKDGEWVRSECGLGLTKEEAIEVLSGRTFPDGPVTREAPDRRDRTPRRQPRQPYGGLKGEELNALGEAARRRLDGRVPGRSEIYQILRWVRRQRGYPHGDVSARYTGERLRARRGR